MSDPAAQIAAHDVDHEPLRRLVDKGEIEVLGEKNPDLAPGRGRAGSVDTHGHHPHDTVKKRGTTGSAARAAGGKSAKSAARSGGVAARRGGPVLEAVIAM